MDLILQVHNGGEGSVAAFQLLLLRPGTAVARGSQPHGQRQVESHIQQVKPEGPVGLTPEARDALRCQERADGPGGRGRRLLLLALPAAGMLRPESSAAGTVVVEGAVGVPEVCTRSGRLAAARSRKVSEARLEGPRQAADAVAAAGRVRQTHFTHAVVGLRKRHRVAAQRPADGSVARHQVVVAGMISHSDICNLETGGDNEGGCLTTGANMKPV